jgi:hypothetical protein
MRQKLKHDGACGRPGLCYPCAIKKANQGIKTDWPKMAFFDSAAPPFGLYREDREAPVQIVIPGTPPRFIGEFATEHISALAELFGLDDPTEALLDI